MRLRWSVTRIAILLVLGLNVAAVFLGRFTGPSPTWRSREGVHHVNINYYLSKLGEEKALRYFDLANGRVGRLVLPEGDLLDQASWSPWVDQDGRSQVVGRWAHRSGEGTSKVNQGFGLARMSFPSGEIVDKVDSDVQPSSPACWFPDTSARVLFSAGDGAIYRYAFEGPVGPETDESGRDLRPSMVRWQTSRPGGGQIYLGEPCWPSSTPGRLGGRLFVSLSHEWLDGKKIAISSPKLWSLRIDVEGKIIDAAEPLTGSGLRGESTEHERFPVVGSSTDGRTTIAFLVRSSREASWRLKIAPLNLSGPSPRVEETQAQILAEACLSMPPVLSADCRWVTCSTIDASGLVQVRRLPVPLSVRPTNDRHLIAGHDSPPHS